MSERFVTWKEAHAHATAKANRTGLDVAIRRVREFGRDGFNVSFASVNDSDYARAEIVKPVAKPAHLHIQDEDCVVRRDHTCCICGVYHGDPCPTCGGRAFHRAR